MYHLKMSLNKFQDPLWQLILYVGMNPLFKLLHRDVYNISLWMLGFISYVCVWYKMYWVGLSLGLTVILFLLFKTYLSCGVCINPYTTERQYNNSYLNISTKIPVLFLHGLSSYDNGYEYGIIMCEEIVHLITRFKNIVRPKINARILKELNISIPLSFRDEILGMYEAINLTYPGKFTYWDILMIQLLPELDNMSCTCYATYDTDGNVILGRNMDWIPFSSAQYSIIISYGNYHSLVVPGLIGCITAWKPNFALAMNVVGGEHQFNAKKLPSMLFNKSVMTYANTIEEADIFISNNQPATAYHLTIANKKNVFSYSFYQRENQKTYIRRMSNSNKTLTVLNWTYPSNDNGKYISKTRDEYIKYIKNKNKIRDIKHVITVLQKCQTFETMHSLIFVFGEIYIPHITIDNGFSADKLTDEVNFSMGSIVV